MDEFFGGALEKVKGIEQAMMECFLALRVGKLQLQQAAMTFDHRQAVEFARRGAIGERAEMAPLYRHLAYAEFCRVSKEGTVVNPPWSAEYCSSPNIFFGRRVPMQHGVERLWAVSHEPEGPLVPYLDAFARSLDEQGFKRRLISQQMRVTAHCSTWLQAEEVAAQDVTDAHVQRFFHGLGRRQSIPRGEFATLRRFIAFLLALGVIPPRPDDSEATPIQQAVDTCTTYLRQERARSDKTLIQYGPFIERFLFECFGHGPVDFAALRAGDVIAFIKHQATRLSPARAKAATTAWRAYST